MNKKVFISFLLLISKNFMSAQSITEDAIAVGKDQMQLEMGIINDKWNVYIESYGELLAQEFITNIDTGIAYKINNQLEWQVSVGKNIKESYHFTSTGMVWQIN